jgi:hypothetical protein
LVKFNPPIDKLKVPDAAESNAIPPIERLLDRLLLPLPIFILLTFKVGENIAPSNVSFDSATAEPEPSDVKT